MLLGWKQRGILLPVSRCDNLIIILKCALRRPSSIHENVTFLSFYFAICFTCACTTTIQLDCDDDTIIRATKLLDDGCVCLCFVYGYLVLFSGITSTSLCGIRENELSFSSLLHANRGSLLKTPSIDKCDHTYCTLVCTARWVG